VGDIGLLDEIRCKLDQVRNLAVEVGGFNLFYFVEMAILEIEEITKGPKPAARDRNGRVHAHGLAGASRR
jgi:hypothetical protein